MDTYHVRTFGCQMNKHDSERIAGMLEARGMRAVGDSHEADVVVFMTCCVRENAEQRLFGQVASLKAVSDKRTSQLIAVGGCIGQRDGEALLLRAPHIDVVFGTHNIARLPALIDNVLSGSGSGVETVKDADDSVFDLPMRRVNPWHAWIPVTVGCSNHCSFCIVPHVRGPERSRTIEEVVAECSVLVADGVRVLSLLGQNVNSFGRDLYGAPRFGDLLKAVVGTGVKRLAFATSHPKDLLEDTVAVIAQFEEIARHIHLPVQSGSNRILKAMNRGYSAEKYLALVETIRRAIPDVAISTDVIVGFPGEEPSDFEDTLDLVSNVGFDQVFSYIYSPRENTPAAAMIQTVPREVASERYERLIEAVHSSALERNISLVGSIQDVVFEGASKRDASMLTGRTSGNKVVHIPLPDGRLPGDFAGLFLPIRIESAHAWFLTGKIAHEAR